MGGITVTILLACVVKGVVADDVDKFVDTLVDRALKVHSSSFQQRGLDQTTLAKFDETTTTTTPAPWFKTLPKVPKVPKVPAKLSITGVMDSPTWPMKPVPTFETTTALDPAGIHCTLKSSDGFGEVQKKSRSIALEKKIGKVCCSLESPAVWPPKPVANIKGSFNNDAANICYHLKSPTDWPMVLGGHVTLDKKVGGTTLKLKTPLQTPVWPPKPTATISHKIGDKDKSICFTLESAVSSLPVKPKATITSTLKTAAATIGASLESQAHSWPPQPTGTFSLQKKVGPLCCKLETKTTGTMRCTFDTSVSTK